MLLMILALSRGFVVQSYKDLLPFAALHALADDGGDGGDGGGGGDGGDGDGGGGDGGDGGSGGGDAGDSGGDNGDSGSSGGTSDSDSSNATSGTVGDIVSNTVNNNTLLPLSGCTNPVATNYNSNATVDNGSCVFPIPTCTLSANPSSLPAGGDISTLSWTSTDATSASIDHGVGSVSPVNSGSTNISVLSSTTFGLTVTGLGGAATCSATVTVVQTPPAPTCTLSANPTSITSGGSSTLSWTSINAISFTIDNGIGASIPIDAGSTTVTPNTTTTYTGTATSVDGTAICTTMVTVDGGVGGGGGSGGSGGGGSGGGGSPLPNISLAMLPHVSTQPLAFLYLSQIPYTGIDLGPVGAALYWILLVAVSLALAYLVLSGAVPFVNRRVRDFTAQVATILNAPASVPQNIVHRATPVEPVRKVVTVNKPQHTSSVMGEAPEAPRGYSSYDGFKSLEKPGGALSIDDIVKGLSKGYHAPHTSVRGPNVEPIYDMVEPIYENVEPIAVPREPVMAHTMSNERGVPMNGNSFASALVTGDRRAVFGALREQIREGIAPEKLVTRALCLLDDVYRARIDGTQCDPNIARVTARLDTLTLERLIAALTTAIDSSYTTSITGAKLALMRALTILGA